MNNLQELYTSILPKIKTLSQAQEPCIIGVTGAMVVGKSTFSEGLKEFLKEKLPQKTVTVINTDGFLFPNKILKEKYLMSKKGFPLSFNQKEFSDFLEELGKNQCESYYLPYYNQLIKDIDPEKHQIIPKSSIYIVEGINLFFPIPQGVKGLSEYFSLLLLLKMPEEQIKRQFLARFNQAWEYSKVHNTDYFQHLKGFSQQELSDYTQDLWDNIHLPFKHQYIDPFEHLASEVLEISFV